MTILVVFVYIRISKKKQKPSILVSYSIKAIGVFGMLVNSIGTIPCFTMMFLTLMCQQDNPAHTSIHKCYTGIYFLHLVVGMLFTF